MKVCVVGAGSIGGFIGARLAAAGQARVSAIARGATLAALRTHGWRLMQDGGLVQAPCEASDRAEDLGPQNLVVIAVKSPAMTDVAGAIGPLLGSDTIVLPAMNGVPWWFGEAVDALAGAPLASVDPGGRIARAIRFDRVLGCVVHASASIAEPGLIQHRMGKGLVIGEPVGGASARVTRVGGLLRRAGFEVSESDTIRREVWYKLWGNLTMNPVSAITGATMDRLLGDPLVRGFCSMAMREAAAIGERIGCAVDQSPEDRHQVTARLGAFKTSMLQDVEAGRPIELDAIVGAVREIGQRLGIDTPMIDGLLGLTRLFARVHGLYPDTAG